MIQALPWFLFGFALLILGIELLVSHNADGKYQTEIARLVQQQRVDQVDIDDARKAFHRVLGERDLARATVRDLLNAQREGHQWPQPQPLPMPPDVDDAFTEEFTQITGRHAWPKWPEQPS